MFLTNRLEPAELLSEMLTRRTLPRRMTRRFRSLKHDRHLCPAFRDNVSAIFDAYKRHTTWTYDIQGFRDGGVDVLVRLSPAGSDLGIQIKSYDEIEKWSKGHNKRFVQTLKAQYSDATETRGVNPYYIVLCADAIRHEKQIRIVNAEFGQYERARIVIPEEAVGFYETPEHKLAAATALLLCEEDTLLVKARSELSSMDLLTSNMVLALLCHAFGADRRNDNKHLNVRDAQVEEWFDVCLREVGEAQESAYDDDYSNDEDDEDDGNYYSVPALDLVGTLDELVARGYLVRDQSSGHVIDLSGFSNALLAVCLGEAARNDALVDQIRPYLVTLLNLD